MIYYFTVKVYNWEISECQFQGPLFHSLWLCQVYEDQCYGKIMTITVKYHTALGVKLCACNWWIKLLKVPTYIRCFIVSLLDFFHWVNGSLVVIVQYGWSQYAISKIHGPIIWAHQWVRCNSRLVTLLVINVQNSLMHHYFLSLFILCLTQFIFWMINCLTILGHLVLVLFLWNYIGKF